MFILEIKENRQKEQYKKTILVYLALSIITFTVNKIYAIFSHGVRSDAMTWMFLYPLIGGTLFYFLVSKLFHNINRYVGYRIFYNIYNSGIALLIVGSLLKGIMEIAGTGSKYVTLYFGIGYLFIAFAIILLVILAIKSKEAAS